MSDAQRERHIEYLRIAQDFYNLFSGKGDKDCAQRVLLYISEDLVGSPPKAHGGNFADHCVYYVGASHLESEIHKMIETGRQDIHGQKHTS